MRIRDWSSDVCSSDLVALDLHGNLAAATSTGGLTNKRPGRVGDTPLIGAGCYATNATCAVSATGTGEAFIRLVAAYDVSARMEYRSEVHTSELQSLMRISYAVFCLNKKIVTHLSMNN